ncbi:MAG: RsmB/NOP family class I SAM-dependent RNA methyltransferase [Thermicanus sp.]|nr:RsmB/NOP family class I SAM-dependent RNA methyltransferase [Thermicanus sp.]
MHEPLPPLFLERMKVLLGNEYEDFLNSYKEPPLRGLRVNSLKIEPKEFQRICPFSLSPIPWAPEGFYYTGEARPGKYPYHAAGLYYLQEPSAMAVVSILDPKPGDLILDLSAAPGGKATQAAVRMKNEGLLVANEIHPVRAKALSENIERLGITNALVVNHSPRELREKWPGRFDKVILDAPCSGEGMFRKEEVSRKEWSDERVKICALRQEEILAEAALLVKPGGKLIYSTCTFNLEENERVIDRFLFHHPSWELLPIPVMEGFRPRFPLQGEQGAEKREPSPSHGVEKPHAFHGITRLWPHLLPGEGHFIAFLQKPMEEEVSFSTMKENRRRGRLPNEALLLFRQFLHESIDPTWSHFPEDRLFLFGEHLYLLPTPALSLKGVRTLRAGLHLGELRKNRFVPSHALSLALPGDAFKNRLSYPASREEVFRYLRGETLPLEQEIKEGWVSIQVDGFPLGWGKGTSHLIKNHYPKGLRWF